MRAYPSALTRLNPTAPAIATAAIATAAIAKRDTD